MFNHQGLSQYHLLNCHFNCSSYVSSRFQVHFRRWGGSYTVVISWLRNLKDSFLWVAPNNFKALTLLSPMSQTVVTTLSPVFWQTSRTSLQNCSHLCLGASMAKVVSCWLLPLSMQASHAWTMKSKVWFSVLHVLPCLWRSSKHLMQSKLLADTQVFSNWHFIIHETTEAV
jgi:hypothetical protein